MAYAGLNRCEVEIQRLLHWPTMREPFFIIHLLFPFYYNKMEIQNGNSIIIEFSSYLESGSDFGPEPCMALNCWL